MCLATLVAMRARKRTAPGLCVLVACSLCTSGCATTRQTGRAFSTLGVLTALVGFSVATGACPNDDGDDDCERSDPDPKTGLPLLGAGVVLTGLGAAMMAPRHRHRQRRRGAAAGHPPSAAPPLAPPRQ